MHRGVSGGQRKRVSIGETTSYLFLFCLQNEQLICIMQHRLYTFVW